MGAVLATENLWRAWSFQPVVIGGGLVAIAFFLHGWRRLHRRRADLAPWTRIPLFVAGVIVTVLAIVSPIDAIGERYLQSVHMLQHVLIADLGIALTVVAVRGPLTVFFLPRDLLVPLARVGWLRRLLRFLLRPGISYARLGRRARLLARPALLRGRAAPSRLARPHAPELHRRRPARLDADHRPVAPPPAHAERAPRIHGARLLDGPDHGLRDPVRLQAALLRPTSTSPCACSASRRSPTRSWPAS